MNIILLESSKLFKNSVSLSAVPLFTTSKVSSTYLFDNFGLKSSETVAESFRFSNRSALTDHAVQENHVISWSAASVIDRESDQSTRWIKEAVHIRKEGPRSMNRDEGSYQLSHTYDRFLGLTLSCRAKNRKKKT